MNWNILRIPNLKGTHASKLAKNQSLVWKTVLKITLRMEAHLFCSMELLNGVGGQASC